MLISTLDERDLKAGRVIVEKIHAEMADGALAPFAGVCEAVIAHCQYLKKGFEERANQLGLELNRATQFIDESAIHGVWTLKDRVLFALYVLLLLLLLGADWFNAGTLLKTAGIPEFAHSEFAVLCATAGAAMLALALKVATPCLIENRKRRYALLLVPGIVLLVGWIVLMSIAFPGYATDAGSLLGGLNAASGESPGLPARFAWLTATCSTPGIASSAAGIACAAEDLYQRHHGAQSIANPHYGIRAREHSEVLARLRETARTLGWHQGELQRIRTLKSVFVQRAAALHASHCAAVRASRPPSRPPR